MRPISEEIVGRTEELGSIEEFLSGASPAALVLEGEPGIGKTTVWTAGAALAAARGVRVLQTRPTEAETSLPFTGLGDLLADVPAALRQSLPPPQRHALAVALLEADAGPRPPDARTIGVALLGVLVALAAERGTLVAIDDLQWLDAPTGAALAFAARRLRDAPVRFLLARRPAEEPVTLAQAFPPERRRTLSLEPLRLGALHRLLRTHLNLTVPRPTLRRIEEISGGNPFFALELGRALGRRRLEADVTLPTSLRRLIGERFEALPAATREALLVVALAAEPTEELVEAALGRPPALGPAIDAEFVVVTARHIRFAHPLFAAYVAEQTGARERDRVHLRLAAAIAEPERRAHHLASATQAGPEPAVADALDEAARRAHARGASSSAAAFSERALALTGTDDPAWSHRAMAAGLHYAEAGDAERAETLLRSAVAALPAGRDRAAALVRLVSLPRTLADEAALAQQALAESDGDPGVRGRARLALAYAARMRGDQRAALAEVRDAAGDARRAQDDSLLVSALADLGWLETILGLGDPEASLREALALSATTAPANSISDARMNLAQRSMWLDRHDEARALLAAAYDDALARGDDQPLAPIRTYLARVELRAGRLRRALELADEAHDIAEQAAFDQQRGAALGVQAMIHAQLGDLGRAHDLADAGEAIAAAAHDAWTPVHIRIARATAAIAARAYAEAAAALDGLAEQLDAAGIREPGIFPFEADAAEALIALGRLDEAELLIRRLEGHGRSLDRPRALATAARCRALACAARGDPVRAAAAFDEALREHERVDIPFEHARTLLVRGIVQRRSRERRSARASLEEALAIFAALPAAVWVSRTNEELSRLGGRRTAEGLTPTEQRVASLVAEGRTNREVAATLVVSVSAVEAHLTRIYDKLGIRSRAELARQLVG